MRLHSTTVFALTLLISACATTRSSEPVAQADVTEEAHLSGWKYWVIEAGVEAYSYAQMSANAYGGRDRFDLGPDITMVADRPNNGRGFAYSVFERRADGVLREVVIAFRGTELTHPNDWILGNIAGLQNRDGLRVFDRVQRSYNPVGATRVPVTVTGHSLGGGIATYVSLRREGANAYVFNTSPRFSRRGAPPSNRRMSIVEYGEVLKAARIFGREPTQTYISINCTPGINFLGGHGIEPLAICLTRIAAWQCAQARQSVARNNISWPVSALWGRASQEELAEAAAAAPDHCASR